MIYIQNIFYIRSFLILVFFILNATLVYGQEFSASTILDSMIAAVQPNSSV